MNIGSYALLQTFDSKVTASLVLRLDNAISEKEKQIALRKFNFSRLKLCVGDQTHRRPAGTLARGHRFDFARCSPNMLRRRMTGPAKTGVALSDVDDTVKHSREDQRPGLLHDSRELVVQLCEKSTRIGGVNRVRFD